MRYTFLKVCRPQLPNEPVSFCAPSYVGMGHISILTPTPSTPSKQSIAKILWTSRRVLGGDVRISEAEIFNTKIDVGFVSLPCDCLAGSPAELPDCRRCSGGSPAAPKGQSGSSEGAVRQLRQGELGGSTGSSALGVQSLSPPCRGSI